MQNLTENLFQFYISTIIIGQEEPSDRRGSWFQFYISTIIIKGRAREERARSRFQFYISTIIISAGSYISDLQSYFNST